MPSIIAVHVFAVQLLHGYVLSDACRRNWCWNIICAVYFMFSTALRLCQKCTERFLVIPWP